MRAIVVVFLVAAASAAVVQEREKRSPGGGGVRLKVQEARVARLANQVEALEDLADERMAGSDHDALIGMQFRLDAAYGARCAKGEYSCSGNSRKCVSNLEVCDGVKDCDNGHDEDSDTCEIIAKAGSSWTGGKVSDRCTNRAPYEMKVIFTDSERLEWFASRAHVKATVILRSKDMQSTNVASLPTSGSYNFATRSVYLDPPEQDRLGLELVFDTGSHDSVDAYVVRESTGERCAQFVLFRD